MQLIVRNKSREGFRLRCRELLGDDAETISDEEVLIVARHAESLADVVIELALQDLRVH